VYFFFCSTANGDILLVENARMHYPREFFLPFVFQIISLANKTKLKFARRNKSCAEYYGSFIHAYWHLL